MPKLSIDGIEVEVERGVTIMQAAEETGAEIPRFCYHDKLSIAGNCRMCLVDVENAPKPVASCAMPVADGMVVHTKSERAVKARNGVMEFLLINHPLDCPICDQGGECDLQDQAVAFGKDRGRFVEQKRAVQDKYMGPLVSTIMTRCIHCTRCIRFAEEVAGVPELGATGRGEDMEITTYLEKTISSELSGNVVDLCPVGALTNKPYAFTARSWELQKTESVDVMDALGSNIRIDTRGREVMRVLPRLNDDINEEWLADKSRNSCDGLKYQRLDQPYIRENSILKPASWIEAFKCISEKLLHTPIEKVGCISGDMIDCEAMLAMKDFLDNLGVMHYDCRQDGSHLNNKNRSSYLFNTSISGIEKADAILLIGTNPRKEAPILNARIRKAFLNNSAKIGVIGEKLDLTYDYEHLSNDPAIIKDIMNGANPFADVLKDSERPMLILGAAALNRKDTEAILYYCCELAKTSGMVNDNWNGFNILHTAAARVGGYDLGFLPAPAAKDVEGILLGAENGEIEFVYLLGADEVDMSRLSNSFVVYQGHHGDAGAQIADVILPGAAYTEKNATYVNTEGRVQFGYKAVSPPGNAREDWTIIRALAESIGHLLPYNTLDELRKRMVKTNAVFGDTDSIRNGEWAVIGVQGEVDKTPFDYPISNYYQTDVISRSSLTMALCTQEINLKSKQTIDKNHA